MTWLNHLPLVLLETTLRYFVIAGVLFFIYYKRLRPRIAYRKIQLRFPQKNDYRRQIGYSCITIIIFSLVGVMFLFTLLRNITWL